MLEQNIQMALQSGQIYLEDAIDIREIKNITLANQVLKYRRIKTKTKTRSSCSRKTNTSSSSS